jgi:hypothetical protein
MDLYFLNFKSVLVILSAANMRAHILGEIEKQNLDVALKFVDSYSEAAKLINKLEHDPFDHIILNLSFSNRKLNDFVEFIKPMASKRDNFIIEYTREGNLTDVQLT